MESFCVVIGTARAVLYMRVCAWWDGALYTTETEISEWQDITLQ
jgi:hypothetical protein